MATWREMIDAVRDQIPEATDNKKVFSDKMILRYLNRGLKKYARKLSELRGDYYYTVETFNPPIDDVDTITLPNGILYSSAPYCTGDIESIYLNDVELNLKYVNEKYINEDEPRAYKIKNRSIYFNGYINTDDEIKLAYFYMPNEFNLSSVTDDASLDSDALAAEIEFPDEYTDLLEMDAIYRACQRINSNKCPMIMKDIMERRKELIESYGGSRSSQPERTPSYEPGPVRENVNNEVDPNRV